MKQNGYLMCFVYKDHITEILIVFREMLGMLSILDYTPDIINYYIIRLLCPEVLRDQNVTSQATGHF